MQKTLIVSLALLFGVPANAACETAPPPVRDIVANSYYVDAHHSIIDPERRAKNIAGVRPLEDFGRQFTEMASKPDAVSHTCAIQWLQAWAAGQSMLGAMASEQAHYEREWMLSELALGYAKARPAAAPEQARAIDAWLIKLAREVVSHVEVRKGKRNNHHYWAGLAVAAAGRVTHDEAATRWGRAVFDFAMTQVESDGVLPYEMDRASRAMHYHLFAAAPLVMLAAILDIDSPKLDKLVAFCVAAIKDPALVAARSGFAQEPLDAPSYDWLVVYARRHPSPEISALLHQDGRTPRVPRLGGSLNDANPLEAKS